MGGEKDLVIFPPEALPYAEIQMGEINRWAGDPHWLALANELVRERYTSIKPFLPDNCSTMLDIGGGIAATDVPILRHYPTTPNLYVLDGSWWDITDPVKHNTPFNDHMATRYMLEANGQKLTGFITPLMAEKMLPGTIAPFDLIVSFAAWGFHFSPDSYIDLVLQHSKSGTRIILDLRQGKDKWKEILQQHFKLIALAYSSRKYERLVYEKA